MRDLLGVNLDPLDMKSQRAFRNACPVAHIRLRQCRGR
jgi:hypothetical protein